MNTRSQHWPFPVSRLLAIRQRGEREVLMGRAVLLAEQCLNPSKPTRARLLLSFFLTAFRVSLFSRQASQGLFQPKMDCDIKCSPSFLIYCGLSRQVSLISRSMDTLQSALCAEKNSSTMICFAPCCRSPTFPADSRSMSPVPSGSGQETPEHPTQGAFHHLSEPGRANSKYLGNHRELACKLNTKPRLMSPSSLCIRLWDMKGITFQPAG